ncbi:MAG: succinate dehydrogenase assembly factor 2 [Proteobacteria bacterium]|nr:succinate dehydrogenase assembly factor 2 [Pseudomonadota bacterium]
MDQALSTAELGRLQWRCRRGLLENDLVLARFFRRHGDGLTADQGAALAQLMDLSDPDLLELLLARREPDGDLATPDVQALLGLLRQP